MIVTDDVSSRFKSVADFRPATGVMLEQEIGISILPLLARWVDGSNLLLIQLRRALRDVGDRVTGDGDDRVSRPVAHLRGRATGSQSNIGSTARYRAALKIGCSQRLKAFNGEPQSYGVEPNRKTLQVLMTYLVDQALIASPIPLDDLFMPTHG